MGSTSSTSSPMTSSTRSSTTSPAGLASSRGRAALMALFRGYVDNFALHSADKLAITQGRRQPGRRRRIRGARGTILATGAKYDNRFCSIVWIENRRIAHWRDYMDSLAAWNILTAPQP